MEAVNRFALIVRPKRRFMEWANALESGGRPLTQDELAGYSEVYLLDATDPDADREEVIDTYADEIWEQQLSGWWTDDSEWPKNRTPHTLRDWFEMTLVDMVFDADPDVAWHEPELTEAEVIDAQIRICQWCETVAGEDEEDPVVTLSFKLRDDDPLKHAGDPLVPIVVAGKVRMAVAAQPDSEAALAGHDLMLTFCSEACASEMREALRRERGAALS